MARLASLTVCLVTLVVVSCELGAEERQMTLLMPNVTPPKPETYFCTSFKLNSNIDYYVVGFKPNASMQTAHHMMVYGCAEPGTTDQNVWSCGDMAAPQHDHLSAPVCQGLTTIIYAWARNAPDLQLPQGVAFHLGRNTHWRHLVLQVHYADVSSFSDGTTTDDSGVQLKYTTSRQPKSAGVFVLGTGGSIQPHTRERLEVACELHENNTAYPFAFRVHTHALGEVVSGYQVRVTKRWNHTPVQHAWTLLGKMNPQLPQMFYKVTQDTTLTAGDILAARCTMYNFRNKTVTVGLTSEHEMCNFYIMYWTWGEPLYSNSCGSYGAPHYYWNTSSSPRLTTFPDQASSPLTKHELRTYLSS